MIYKTVQGEDVPALGFGTYKLTGRTCRDTVADALAIGYRHIDTAQSYNNEEEVGKGLHAAAVAREDIFLTTKVWRDRLDKAGVRSSTEESLRKLRTDYVDLLLIHWPSDDVPIEETLEAMLTLKEESKANQVGVSNFTTELVQRAVSYAPIFCNQVEYHPYLKQEALLALAESHEFLLTAYSPIARGDVRKDPALQQIAAEHAKSPEQVSLRWLIQQTQVAAIPKAASADHRRQNFDIFDFELSDEEMEVIFSLGRGSRIVNPDWGPSW